MRILVLGAGGIGGYFGARLAAGGGDITFLVRPRRAAELARHGLVVRSPRGDLSLSVHATTAATEAFDLVLLACKAYDLDAAADAIAQAVGEGTTILPLLNGLRHFDALDARFGSHRVLGGLCHIGVTLTEGGEIEHLNALDRLSMGWRQDAQRADAERAHAALQAGGFSLQLSPVIDQEMWEKFAFLAAYAGITCLMRATIGSIASADDGPALAVELFEECAAVAAAAGHAPRPAFAAESRRILTDPASSGTASMLRDVRRHARTEEDHILGDMLRRARQAGLAAPILRVARAHLQAYEAARVSR
jgi:2-dehydropantoate 2-reductase